MRGLTIAHWGLVEHINDQTAGGVPLISSRQCLVHLAKSLEAAVRCYWTSVYPRRGKKYRLPSYLAIWVFGQYRLRAEEARSNNFKHTISISVGPADVLAYYGAYGREAAVQRKEQRIHHFASHKTLLLCFFTYG